MNLYEPEAQALTQDPDSPESENPPTLKPETLKPKPLNPKPSVSSSDALF